MSATLFGRGVMTQVGGRRRAEATDAAITTLRSDLVELKTFPTVIRGMDTRLQASERRVASLEAELSRLQGRLSALESVSRTPSSVPHVDVTEST